MPDAPISQVWSGSVSFGLVNVPVALVPATKPMDFRFRELHRPDLAPVERRRFCLAEEAEVDREEIGRGYDLGGGQMVTLTEDELASVAPERTRTIEIETFADPDEIDPIHLHPSYFVAPTGKGEGDRRAYQLLVEAMRSEQKAAIGRFVMRTREYLVAIRARDRLLCLTTLLYPDEVRPVDDVPMGEVEASGRTVDEAVAVIEELSTDWDPDSYEDCYRERLSRVIAEKRSGREVKVPEPVVEEAGGETAAPDLMSALKKTLDEARQGQPRRRRRAKPLEGRGKAAGSGRKGADEPTREELYRRAQEAGVSGRSKMSKEELREALGD